MRSLKGEIQTQCSSGDILPVCKTASAGFLCLYIYIFFFLGVRRDGVQFTPHAVKMFGQYQRNSVFLTVILYTFYFCQTSHIQKPFQSCYTLLFRWIKKKYARSKLGRFKYKPFLFIYGVIFKHLLTILNFEPPPLKPSNISPVQLAKQCPKSFLFQKNKK